MITSAVLLVRPDEQPAHPADEFTDRIASDDAALAPAGHNREGVDARL